MDQDMGTDFLQLDPSSAPPKGRTAWLAAQIRAAIMDGRLPAGSRLPPTRVLAAELGTARGVVVEAYQRLTDESLVGAHGSGGTIVQYRSGLAYASRPPRSVTPALLPMAAPEHGIDLSPGLPDMSNFPRQAWIRAHRRALDAATPHDLGYGDPSGHPGLRRELAAWLARQRGLRVHPDEIVIVAGVAQSLALLMQVLRTHGVREVGVEDPGSRGARDAIAHWGIRLVPVRVDDQGIRVDEMTTNTVVLTPAHQFPTGVVLSPQRRRALADWADATGDALIVEDDYDAEYRYDRTPVPALHASAPEHVAYAGSASKTLAPGIRLGWLIPPKRLAADVIAAKHASDLGSSAIVQLTMAELFASGDYDRHIRLVRARQRRRRDALLRAIERYVPGATVHGVSAGLHVLVTVDRGDDEAVAAGLRTQGIGIHPLSWHRSRPGPPGFVIGYAANPPDRLAAAVAALGAALAN
jgi:GntR family transcriptional regulator/MocR family aminotransferase